MPAESYYSVLTAAVNDFIERGFVSSEQLAYWMDKLRRAADITVPDEETLAKELRQNLQQTFTRALTHTGLERAQRGVSKFTIDRLRPLLRLELERRSMAAANLIRDNREEAISKTLKRFAGWATAIPPGGTAQAERIQQKQSIRLPLSRLPAEARRLAVDQGNKLNASLHDMIATEGGAIAGEWNSNWRQPGYDYRVDHQERDGSVFLIRDSWAHQQGLVKGDFIDQLSMPAQEPFCRCSYKYIYRLRNLPSTMLTAKGRAALEDNVQYSP